MRRMMPSETSCQERGATAILAALLMTVILGFAGLAIDLGATYAKQTELQTGADAAALAIAQEYATVGCNPNSVMATSWVQQNVNNDVPGASGTATCPAVNRVTVVAEGIQEHWFMPVLGKDTSDVSADATVEWGVPMAGPSIPLAISNCRFEKYFGGDEYIGLQQDIWMEHPNDPEGNNCEGEDGGMPSGGFSWLETIATGACQAQVVLDPDGDGGWVGSDTGVPPPNDQECKKPEFWQALVDQPDPIYIPIFDYAVGPGGNAKYHVTQFASFDLHGVFMQSGPASGMYGTGCDPNPSNYKNCLSGKFIEFISIKDMGLELGLPSGPESTVIVKLVD